MLNSCCRNIQNNIIFKSSYKTRVSFTLMLPLLLRINLSQIFTVYDIQPLQKLPKGSQENILGGVTLVYNRYSEQPLYNLTKRRTVPPVFFGEIFKNGWLWIAASEQSKIVTCNVILLPTIKIFWALFYNVTLNNNIEFLKVATSERIVFTEQT